MLKNFAKCPHCGKQPVRLSEKTVLLNRSDGKKFHLTMFSGPYRRQVTAGDLRDEELFCTFSYVHDRIGPNNEYVAVMIDRAQAARMTHFAKLKTSRLRLRASSRAV